MGRSRLLLLLLVAALLSLCISQGFGRKLMETAGYESSSAQFEETEEKSRKMVEVMDYPDPEPNVNPRTGVMFSPPPSQG